MIKVQNLDPKVAAVGKALGLLVSDSGGLRLEPGFFAAPGDYISQILSSPAQRQALLDALGGLLPPEPLSLEELATAGESQRHPLFPLGARGQLYLAFEGSVAGEGPLDVGLLAEARSPDGPTLTAALPLVRTEGSTLTDIAGTPGSPLQVSVRVPLGAGGAASVTLLLVRPPDVEKSRLSVRLEPASKPVLEFDPLSLPGKLGPLVAGILQSVLALAGPAVPPEARMVADHLPGLLGLSDGLPPLPLDHIATDPGAMRAWLGKLLASNAADGQSALRAWLDHIGQLLGAPPLPPGGGALPSENEPLLFRLLADEDERIEVWLTAGLREAAGDPAGVLVLGARVRARASDIDAAVCADAALLALPLTGTAPAAVAEHIDLLVQSPAGPGVLYPPASGGTASIAVGQVRAGMRYRAGKVEPVLELHEVAFGEGAARQRFQRLDLTDAQSLGAAARDALSTAILEGLGPDTAPLVEALQTLLGLGSSPGVDLARLATAPTRALADYYRALRSSEGGWPRVLRAVAQLLGAQPGELWIDGSGHRDDPWRVLCAHFPAPAGALPRLFLAIWDDADTGSDTPQLRIGLQLQVANPDEFQATAWTFTTQSELLGFDLPPGGGGAVRFIGEQRAAIRIVPPLPHFSTSSVTAAASAIALRASWRPGTPLTCEALIEDLMVNAAGSSTALGTLRFPSPSFDPAAPALGLGLSPQALWTGARPLLSQAARAWAGPLGEALAAMLGVGTPGTAGLAADLPPLTPPRADDLGSLLGDPLRALRSWLELLSSEEGGLSQSGGPFLDGLRQLLQGALTGRLPLLPGLPLPGHDVPLEGSGTWEVPWTIPIHPAGGLPVELLTWLEPDGPMHDWAQPILTALEAEAPSAEVIVQAAGALSAYLPAAPFEGQAPTAVAEALESLTAALSESDGMVPLGAALPDSSGWTAAEQRVHSTHLLLPRAPAAIAQILARTEALTTGLAAQEWAVVLLAPAQAGEDAWDALLASASPASLERVNLRQGLLDPLLVDLGTVRAASHYVVDLSDNGTATLAQMTAQLSRVVDRILTLKPRARVLLVAHSYLGVVSQQLAADRPRAVLGLIALGAPLAPVQVPALTDPIQASAVRFIRRLSPEALTGEPVMEAIEHLALALDGYSTGLPGTPPRAEPFPLAAFVRAPAAVDLHGVPALAIAGWAGGDLLRALAGMLRDRIAPTAGKLPPTHLGYGVRVGLALPEAEPGGATVDATLRLNLGRLAFLPDAPESEVPARGLVFRAKLSRPNGWLLGGPGQGTPLPARVRAAEFEGWIAAGDGGPRSGISIRLHDAALRGSGVPILHLSDTRALALLAELVRELAATSPAGGRAAVFLKVLEELRLIQREAAGGAMVRADALAAIQADAAAYLAPLLPTLLDRAEGLFGLQRPPGIKAGAGPWSLHLAPLPVEVVVQRDPWRITVRTLGEGLPLLAGGKLAARSSLRLDTLDAEVDGRLTVHGLRLEREAGSGRVLLDAAELAAPVSLFPPDPAALRAALAPLLLRRIIDAAFDALLSGTVGLAFPTTALSGLLVDAARWLIQPSALGDGRSLRPTRINTLLKVLATTVGLESTPEHPLALPGGLVLLAEEADGGARLKLYTPTPLEFGDSGAAGRIAFSLSATLTIDATRHVTPGGELTLHLPLPEGDWGALDLSLAVAADGAVSLWVTPPELGTRVDLLPRVAGLPELLLAGAQRLLPEVLDALVEALSQPSRSRLLQGALDVAKAIEVYDPAATEGGFKARAQQLAQLVQQLSEGGLSGLAANAARAAAALLRLILGNERAPVPATPTAIAVSVPLGSAGNAQLQVDLGTTPPSVSLAITGLSAGPVEVDTQAAYAPAGLSASVQLRARLDTGAGLVLTPRLDAGLAADELSVTFRPLGTDDVILPLAPSPVPPTMAHIQRLAEAWVLPLAATLLVRQAEPLLSKPLWPGASRNARQVLETAGLIDDRLVVKLPVAPTSRLLAGALEALSGLEVPLPGELALALVKTGPRYGLRLSGELGIPAQGLGVALRFGAPEAVTRAWENDGQGPTLYLLELAEPAPPKLAVSLSLGGLGVELEGAEGKPLVDTAGFRLGGAAAYVLAEIPLHGTDIPGGIAGGAVALSGLGFPLAAPGEGGGNPIAASLLRSKGGDQTPVNPPLDLTVIKAPKGWSMSLNGKPELRLPLRQSFGPVHIDEILMAYEPAPGDAGHARLGIDGSVSLAGLTVAVDDLSVRVPLRHPADLGKWQLDLGGLGVGLVTPAVSLAGALVKSVSGGFTEYRGGISASFAGRSLTAIGAYSQPTDALGRYTSLFVFVSVPFPLGGPPYLFVLGLAGGAGFNRRLLVPRDPDSVPSFPLVAAMSGGMPENPVEALSRIGSDIPPSRGSYWVAAGVYFTTFELIRTQALVYVALDGGFEVGVLGLMRMMLPRPEAAVVSVELAMAARFSTVDRVLSVRAGLTRNSWLISRDCQLSGGFAFVVWFDRAEAVMTLGGYHPAFAKPAHYPEVPRVGFHWAVGRGITVKGGAYFALTPKALMLGGLLEASYDISPIRAWFTASLDVIVHWDPFTYVADAQVNIGASFVLKVCLWKKLCKNFPMSVNIGALVHLEGPPLYAHVLVDLEVASIPIEFGERVSQPFLSWEQFRAKYLGGGDLAAPGTKTGVLSGLRPTGTSPRDGQTPEKAWLVSPEFAVRVETRMPATFFRLSGASSGTQRPAGSGVATPDWVDVVPVGSGLGPVNSALGVTLERRNGASWVQVPTADLDRLVITPRQGHFPVALWRAGTHADGSGPNIAALGSLEISVPTAARERTGAFGDNALPFATLVEEAPARRLPLQGLSAIRAVASPDTAQRVPSGTAEATRSPPARPRLLAVVPPLREQRRPPRPAVRRTTVVDDLGLTPRQPPPRLPRARLLRVPARHGGRIAAPVPSGEALRPGVSQIWDLPDRAAGGVDVRLEGTGAVRITALSGTGAPLLDLEGPPGAFVGSGPRVPAGTARLVISGLGAARGPLRAARGAIAARMAPASAVPATGWQLNTVLLQVAPGTLLAHGAIVLTPQPFVPPRGFRRGDAPCRVPAARVTAAIPALATLLPMETEVVVVQADRRARGTGLGDLVITTRDGKLGPPAKVEQDGRLCLIYPVRARSTAEPLEVSVASAADFRLTGVVGLSGTVKEWSAALERDPRLRMIDEAPLTGGSSEPEVSVRLSASGNEGGLDDRDS
jgi:hypothetical protein